MGGGSAGGRGTSWRALAAAVLALWLLPAVLALALLWLPALCCAVAAVRFHRARNELVARRPRGCGGREEEEEAVDAGDRTRLLHRYLDDQMDLVGASEETTQGRTE